MQENLPTPVDAVLPPSLRKQVLSTNRFRVLLTAFVGGLIVAVAGLVAGLVLHIFAALTPAIHRDLRWQTVRGAEELARVDDLGILVGDRSLIEASFEKLRGSEDLLGIVVLDGNDKVLTQHGTGLPAADVLFAGPAAQVHETRDTLVAWAPARVEGSVVGKVAVVMSTARLRAGEDLLARLLQTGLGACLVALLLSLGFVNFYLTPLIRLTERAFVELEGMTHAALAANRLKSEFLANMSHEIRTPMNGIVGMAALLMRSSLAGRERRYAEVINSSAETLLTLLNDILDFSKIEAGKLDVRAEAVDVRRVVHDALALSTARAQGKGLTLAADIAADVPGAVRSDPDRLRQILLNLLSNATKFTEHGGITLRVRYDGLPAAPALRFEVVDTGVGLTADDVQRLFKPFTQVDGSLTRKAGGTGLGLAICKQLAELMGGSIGVISEVGRGSTFWFTVAAQSPGAETHRALVLGDDAALVTSLAEAGVVATCSQDADTALQMLQRGQLQQNPFELLLVPATPEGLRLCRAVRQDAAVAHTTCVLLTPPGTAAPADAGVSAAVTWPAATPDWANRLPQTGLPTLPSLDSAPAQARSLCVLLVDDNEVNQEVGRDTLTDLGHTVDIAPNGRVAVQMASERAYDVVFMDIQMPEMNGYDATAEIRRRETAAGGRERRTIVAMTAHAFEGERQKARAAGMDDYVTKPIRVQALRTILDRCAARALDTPVVPVETPPANPSLGQLVDAILEDGVTRKPKIVDLFLRTTPARLDALQRAIAAAEPEALREAAHTLKGSCLTLGVPRMSALCKALETADLAQAPDLLALLMSEFDNARQALTPASP